MIKYNISYDHDESFQFYGKDYLGVNGEDAGILAQDEYLKRKNIIINSSNNKVGNLLNSDINLLGNKNNLIKELGEILHLDWKELYKTQLDYGVEILSDGSITPRNKETSDHRWIEKNGGKKIVDIANTDFDDLPNDWKRENIDAAESALSYFIRHFKKDIQINKDFIDEFSLYNHNEWLKRNGRVFEEKKDSEDYYKDYNISIEKEKDIQISKKVIAFYAEKLLLNDLGKQGHLDWLEIYKTQGNNYENGIIKPNIKETKDKKWIEKNLGVNTVDIANTDFDDLPEDWKEKNITPAKETLDSIYDELSNGVNVENENIIEKLALENHELWKKRNQRIYDEKNGAPHLAVKYFELDEKEKEKNRVMITRAIDTLKEHGLLYEYIITDSIYDESVILGSSEFDNMDISELFKGYKNEGSRGNIINIFNSYLVNRKNNIKELKSEINNLDLSNLLIYYSLLKGNGDNSIFKELSLYIEEKYDENLLFRYFRFFSRTRFEILKEDIISEKNKIIEKYGKDFYSSEGKDYNLRYVSNDIIAFSDENKNIGTPLFYYKIINNDGKVSFKKILADELLDGYSFFDDMEESSEVDYSFLVQILHYPLFNEQFELQLGFNFKKMPFYIQPRFIKFLSETNFDEFDRIKSLFKSGKTKEEKYNRLNSFIGTYNNKDFSDIILRLGESDLLDDEVKNSIFKKYSDLLVEINKGIEVISLELGIEDKDTLFNNSIHDLNSIFLEIHNILERESINYNNSIDLIIKSRDDFRKARLFYRELRDKSITNLEDLAKIGVKYEKKRLKNLNKYEKIKVKKDIISLYEKNYPEYGKFVKEVEKGLKDNIDLNKEMEFHNFYVGGDIILSLYFIDEGDYIYSGGLNIDKDVEIKGLGFWSAKKILDDYKSREIRITATSEIEGDVNPDYKKLVRGYGISFNFVKGDYDSNDTSAFTNLVRYAS